MRTLHVIGSTQMGGADQFFVTNHDDGKIYRFKIEVILHGRDDRRWHEAGAGVVEMDAMSGAGCVRAQAGDIQSVDLIHVSIALPVNAGC